MADAESSSTLQRKMSASRSGSTVSGRALLRALRLVTARAAFAALELPLQVIGATQDRRTKADLGLSDDRLLMLLDGGEGQIGIATLDPSCVMALIQHQTMGQVLGGEPPERALTATDAAMAAPLLDEIFRKAPALVEGEIDKRCLEGFSFGALVDDVQRLLLMLDADQQFRAFDLTVEFSGASCQGKIGLVLPEPAALPVAAPQDGDAPGRGVMQRNLGVIRADLRVVVGRTKVPLSNLTALQPGDRLTIDDAFLDRAQLLSIEGRRVTEGRLGQLAGMRALRVNEPDADRDKSVVRDGVGFAGDLPGLDRSMSGAPATAAPPMGGMPDLPGLPEMGAPSDLPGLDSLEPSSWEDALGMPSAPMPDLPGMDNDIAGMSTDEAAADISQLAGLDDAPGDFGELPALPDLPDLPDLPAMDEPLKNVG